MHIDRIMRTNPTALAVFYVSGLQSAALANNLSADVATRIILVNSEAESALKAPEKFRQVVDISFRHALAGALTAQTFFHRAERIPAGKAIEKP